MAQIIHPASEQQWLQLRTEDITSTESAALVDLHPRLTLFELHQRKAGRYDVAFEETDRTKWGTRLQDVIARGVAEDYAIKVRRASYYARHDTVRMGASFDFEIVGIDAVGRDDYLGELVDLYEERGPGVLEVKNVDSLVFLKDWLIEKDDSGKATIEAPTYIEVQLQHQLECVNREWGVIAALVGGNRPIVLTRSRDRAIGKRLVDLTAEFWERVKRGTDPVPDFRRDADVIARLYGHAEPGKILDASGDEQITTLCREYRAYADAEKNANEEKQARKSELLTLIGDAEKILANGYTISAGVVGPSTYTVERKGYRNFKITPKPRKKGSE